MLMVFWKTAQLIQGWLLIKMDRNAGNVEKTLAQIENIVVLKDFAMHVESILFQTQQEESVLLQFALLTQ